MLSKTSSVHAVSTVLQLNSRPRLWRPNITGDGSRSLQAEGGGQQMLWLNEDNQVLVLQLSQSDKWFKQAGVITSGAANTTAKDGAKHTVTTTDTAIAFKKVSKWVLQMTLNCWKWEKRIKNLQKL